MILNGLNAATDHNLYQQPDTQQIFVFITFRELRIGTASKKPTSRVPENYFTPALATCQPRDECSETIPLSPCIIHMSDEELGCPGNYRQGIIAQWAKFQGNFQKH